MTVSANVSTRYNVFHVVDLKRGCSKGCGREAKPNGRYCRVCHAEYMRDHRQRMKIVARNRAFMAGFSALKADLMEVFVRIGRGELNGYAAHEIVKNSKVNVPRET